MELEGRKVCQEKLYSIGYIPKLNKYVLECVVPWIVWYNRYYEISEIEYHSFESAPDKLNELADYLHKKSYNSDRFLFSERDEENSESQSKLRAEITAE